jgi:uncharacterized protein YsxB (DUF464 family)
MMDIRLSFANHTVIAAGHANAPRNEDGRDLVCCAVSTLVQTLIFSCQELPGVLVYHNVAPGDVYIKVSEPDSATDGVKHRLMMLLDGLKHLEKQYPELIRVTSDQ